MLRFCSCASEFGSAAYLLQNNGYDVAKIGKGSGITTPSAARPQHALAGRRAEILVSFVGYFGIEGRYAGRAVERVRAGVYALSGWCTIPKAEETRWKPFIAGLLGNGTRLKGHEPQGRNQNPLQ